MKVNRQPYLHLCAIYREIEFVLQESKALDDMGLLVTTHSKKTRIKGKEAIKHPKARKNMQKIRYVFNHEIETKPQYLENFRPNDQVVEARLLGLSEMARVSFRDGEQNPERWVFLCRPKSPGPAAGVCTGKLKLRKKLSIQQCKRTTEALQNESYPRTRSTQTMLGLRGR